MLTDDNAPPTLNIEDAQLRSPQLLHLLEKWSRHAQQIEESVDTLGRKIHVAHGTGMTHRESCLGIAQSLVDTAQMFPRLDGENCLAKFGLTLAKMELSHETLLKGVGLWRWDPGAFSFILSFLLSLLLSFIRSSS